MSLAQDVWDQPYDFLIQKDRELREASYLLCGLQTARRDYKTGSYSDVFQITTGRKRQWEAQHI